MSSIEERRAGMTQEERDQEDADKAEAGEETTLTKFVKIKSK
mgnify:CR=1 FL=1